MNSVSFNPSQKSLDGHKSLGRGGSFWLPPKMSTENFETNLKQFSKFSSSQKNFSSKSNLSGEGGQVKGESFKSLLPQSQSSAYNSADKSNPYLSDYQIVNGNTFPEINGFIGKRVEIIGKVVEVREGKSQFGLDRRLRPYIYLDMDELKKGKLFRIKFLPDIVEGAILSGSSLPNKKWIGKWVTITETIQPKNILMLGKERGRVCMKIIRYHRQPIIM